METDKYFIRMFWGYDYEGSPEWLENEKKHGVEEWAEIERNRVDAENKSSMWMKGHVDET